jgi:Family of unknown function (DUF5996)
MTPKEDWPALNYEEWRETGAALHRWSQIVGKYRLANTPWVNHAWHATLYVTPRGLTTGLIPAESGAVMLSFDFCDHRLVAEKVGGLVETFPLEAMSVAEFLDRTNGAVERIGGSLVIHGAPNELADATPFVDDLERRPYDARCVAQFHQALLKIAPVFQQFRTAFLGKVSPVHLFWGALDLAVTRFSGRRAPLHPGGIPNLPDAVTREAYSHEVSSAGFWAGDSGVKEAMFYSYAYPEPRGFRDQRVQPDSARFDSRLGEYLLPYDDVRRAAQPEEMLLAFLRSTYRAAAVCGAWDRAALECSPGRVRTPRDVAERESKV